ncbi:MAG: hypothetical protein EA344_01560 [Alkalicoccus sp.]|nr:MAG: hypothetical protein EA344_01560 [Alkalicoccus sp.]
MKPISLIKNWLSLRNGGDAGGMKRSHKILFYGAGQTAEDQPYGRLPPVREGVYTLIGINMLKR